MGERVKEVVEGETERGCVSLVWFPSPREMVTLLESVCVRAHAMERQGRSFQPHVSVSLPVARTVKVKEELDSPVGVKRRCWREKKRRRLERDLSSKTAPEKKESRDASYVSPASARAFH